MDADRKSKTGIRIIPFLLVIAVCLIAGILLGSITGGNRTSPAQTKNPPLTLVFLGYDSIRAPVTLEAVWVLSLDGNGGADFKGISPAIIVTTGQGQPAVLRDFLADPLDAPSRMYELSLIPQPSTAVTFDRQAFSTLVNRLGGVPIDGKYVRGPELLDFLSQDTADPLAGLRAQLRVVKSLFGSGPCLSESALAGLQPDHMISSLPADLLVTECKKRGPYLQGSVRFNILDDVIPWTMPDGSIGLLPNS
jgi:hypothetical protein